MSFKWKFERSKEERRRKGKERKEEEKGMCRRVSEEERRWFSQVRSDQCTKREGGRERKRERDARGI